MRVNFFSQSGNQNTGPSQGLSATLTGPLVLAGNPTSPLEAAPKQYVDSAVNSLNAANIKTGTLAAARLPAFTGDAASATGSGTFILANSGVSAGTYTKVTVDSKGRVVAGSNITNDDIPPFDWSKITSGKPTTVDGYGISDALKTGDSTVVGTLSLNLDPTNDMHAANKQYVDSLSGNGSNILTGTTTRRPLPTTPDGFLRANGGLVSRTTYSALFAVIKDAYVTKANLDYTSYAALGAGVPWENQYDSNTNPTSDTLTWTTSSIKLTANTTGAGVVVTKNRVYIIGGYSNGFYYNTVQTAAINADGTVGTFSQTTSLPVAMLGVCAFVTKNRLYVFGGRTSGGNQRTTYHAPINTDGTLGAWATGGTGPDEISFGRAVVTKNRVYVLGHEANDNTVAKIYVATINSNGTIGAWSTATSTLPSPTQYAQVTVTKNRVYVFGSSNSSTQKTLNIFTAIINADGTLGTWSTVAVAGVNLQHTRVYVAKDRVYLIGGYDTSAAAVNTVYTATIKSDGTLNAWSIANAFPIACYSGALFATSKKLYYAGGQTAPNSGFQDIFVADLAGVTNDYSAYYDGTINKFDGSDLSGSLVLRDDYELASIPNTLGNGRPWEQQHGINSTQSGALGSWAGGALLANGLRTTNVVVTKNRVYLFGGYTNGDVTNSYEAPINADGSIGTWIATNPLPTPMSYSAVITTKNRVYLLGRYMNDGTGPGNIALTAPINADGTITTWTTINNPFPGSVGQGTAIVTKKRVYLSVGYSGNGVIYTAPINADGTLGTWITSNVKFSGTIYENRFFATNKYIYNIGGSGAGTSVTMAPIYDDGTIGEWRDSGTAVLTSGQLSSVVVVKNTVYVFSGGGTSSSNAVSQYAKINADGTLGAFTAGPNLFYGTSMQHPFITSSRIYLVGGWSGADSRNVQYASFAGGKNDYMGYLDGTITGVDTTKFALPDLSEQESTNEFYFIKT